MMEEIIASIPREILKAELTPDKRLRMTNKSSNEVYVVTWQDSPNVVREIGRLREIAFRAAGGGTGKSLDLDEFDTCENPTSRFWFGIPKQKRLWEVTDIYWVRTGNMPRTDSPFWLPVICSALAISS